MENSGKEISGSVKEKKGGSGITERKKERINEWMNEWMNV